MPSHIAFLIGNQNYAFEAKLNTPTNDVKSVATILNQNYNYETYTEENLTKSNLEAFFKNVMPQKLDGYKQAETSVLIYFAGHGVAFDDDKGPNGYLIPIDGKMNERETCFSMSTMLNLIELLPCQHLLLILDCCFSGAVRWAAEYRGERIVPKKEFGKPHYKYYTEKAFWKVLTSTAHNQLAFDRIGNSTENKHSPFAKCLIDGLKGNATLPSNKVILISELFTYLKKRLPKITGAREQGITQYPGLHELRKHDVGEYLFFMEGFNPDDLEELGEENPYQGLSSYKVEHKDLFFGRKTAIKKLFDKVEKQSLTVVLGASGSGKSSLVRAGILPKYKIEPKHEPVIEPGRNPKFPTEVYDILVIDQFEQLLTQSDIDEAQLFLQQLETALDNQQKIIITMRIDLESQLVMSDGLKAYWSKGRFIIPSITLEEWREMIITPAVNAGRFIEPLSLVDTIVEEVIHYPGSLPLLSFTMQHLFEVCKGELYRNITKIDYAKIGGVIGALQAKADAVFESLDISEQHAMRYLILRMISLTGGQNAGRKVFEQELIFTNDAENKSVAIVIDKLLENRLIRVDKDANEQKYYEPVHDALVYSWGKVSNWVKQEDLPLQESLRLAVYKYANAVITDTDVEDAIESSSWLWNSNPQIEILEKLLGTPTANWMNKQEMDFVLKSLKRRENIITRLTNERDEATANAMAYKSQLELSVDATKALQMIKKAYTIKETIVVTETINKIVKENIFYQIISAGEYYHYLCANHGHENLILIDRYRNLIFKDRKTFETVHSIKCADNWYFNLLKISIHGVKAVASIRKENDIKEKVVIIDLITKNYSVLYEHNTEIISINIVYDERDGEKRRYIGSASKDGIIKIYDIEISKIKKNGYLPNFSNIKNHGYDPFECIISFSTFRHRMIIASKNEFYFCYINDVCEFELKAKVNTTIKGFDNIFYASSLTEIIYYVGQNNRIVELFIDDDELVENQEKDISCHTGVLFGTVKVKKTKYDRNYIVTCNLTDGRIIVLNNITNEIKYLLGHTETAELIDFSYPNSLISFGRDHKLKLWNFDTLISEDDLVITNSDIIMYFAKKSDKFVTIKSKTNSNDIFEIAIIDWVKSKIIEQLTIKSKFQPEYLVSNNTFDEIAVIARRELMIIDVTKRQMEIYDDITSNITMVISYFDFAQKTNVFAVSTFNGEVYLIIKGNGYVAKKTFAGQRIISLVATNNGDVIYIGTVYQIFRWDIKEDTVTSFFTNFKQLTSMSLSDDELYLLFSIEHTHSIKSAKINISGQEKIFIVDTQSNELKFAYANMALLRQVKVSTNAVYSKLFSKRNILFVLDREFLKMICTKTWSIIIERKMKVKYNNIIIYDAGYNSDSEFIIHYNDYHNGISKMITLNISSPQKMLQKINEY